MTLTPEKFKQYFKLHKLAQAATVEMIWDLYARGRFWYATNGEGPIVKSYVSYIASRITQMRRRAKMPNYHVYKCTITQWLETGSLSYGFLFAAITAESKSAAVRMAEANVKNFRSCKVEQVVDAKSGAAAGIKWM